MTQAIPLRGQEKEDLDRIVEAIVYVYTENRRAAHDLARKFGLTGPQVTAIKVLERIGDMSLSDLSERIRATNSTMTGLVDRLSRDGLVQRVRSRRDRRVVLIRLTPLGAKLAGDIPVAPMDLFNRALALLDVRDRDDLRRLLRKLTDHIRAEIAAAETPQIHTHNGG